jgi:hypothetical protein
LKADIKLTNFFVKIFLLCIAFGLSAGFSEKQACLLPWQIVADKVHAGCLFWGEEDLPNKNMLAGDSERVSVLDPNCNYAHQPNQPIAIKLPASTSTYGSLQKIDIYVSKWAEGSWSPRGKIAARLEPNEVKINDGITEEGFFQLRFTLRAANGQPSSFETYTIVCGDWKRDILAFCRKLKEEVELGPDPQLIRSCIATSHFDYVMQLVSGTSILSGKDLKALADAVRSKQDFADGKCPDLVVGLNKLRLRRFAGAPIEEFVVFIPDNYESSKDWPVFLHTDSSRWAAKDNYSSRSGFIDLWWHTISHKDIGWKDYSTVMRIIEEKLNVDKNRIYVNGECGNGIATMALALNYPDQWAECSTVLGNSYRHLAGNALNLPLIFVKGGHNEDPLIGYYHFAAKCFQYHGCRDFKHSETQNIVQARGAPLPQAVREKNPQRVLYTIESLQNPKAYWVTINGREDENLPATMDACVWGQTVLVRTKNVDAYTLDLSQAPVDLERPIEIIENGRSLGFVTDQVFTRKAEKYANAAYIKNERLQGPVWDAFTDPYVVVWGAGGKDKGFSEVSETVARSLANGGPCFADANLPRELLENHNLILVGTAGSNIWLAKICENLPVQIKEGRLVAGDKYFDGPDIGFIFIYPNPLNPERYVATFSGTSPRAMANISKAYSQMKSIRPADVGIFEIDDNGNLKWHIMEQFNTVWGWHREWDKVLAVTNKKYQKWQWHQWVARTLREQLGVDVVLCEEPFRFEDLIPVGQVTYRVLHNSFRNDWIITLKLDGKSLRELLMVPFNDISKREVSAPIISGVSFAKIQQGPGETVLAINELEDDKKYTIALPEKCINGERIGLVLKDYKIIGEDYLVPLLKDYLCENKTLDIDAQLANFRVEIF